MAANVKKFHGTPVEKHWFIRITLGKHVSDNNNLMTTLTGRLVQWIGTVGPAISDNNRGLILLYGIEFCRGHALLFKRNVG